MEAENGRVAMERMQQKRPCLILLDLMMPEVDGFEFAAWVRQRREWQSIPIVVITARDLTKVERQRLSGHVEKILQKQGDSREAMLHQLVTLLHNYSAPKARLAG